MPKADKMFHPFAKARLPNPFGKGETADDHLPPRQISILARRTRQHHMQKGWHAMREGHLFPLDQSQQHIRQIATWVNLLDTHGCCHDGCAGAQGCWPMTQAWPECAARVAD